MTRQKDSPVSKAFLEAFIYCYGLLKVSHTEVCISINQSHIQIIMFWPAAAHSCYSTSLKLFETTYLGTLKCSVSLSMWIYTHLSIGGHSHAPHTSTILPHQFSWALLLQPSPSIPLLPIATNAPHQQENWLQLPVKLKGWEVECCRGWSKEA